MSDDRSGRHEPDDTREFTPFPEDESAPTDETMAGPSGTEVGPDGGPRSGGSTADDATTRISADRAAMMPRSGAPDVGRAEAAARAAAGSTAPDFQTRLESGWAGRAEVRAPRPGAGGDFTATQWAPVGTEPRRLWWSPILIGVLLLLLVALLGVGIWLIAGSMTDGGTQAPAATTGVTTATRTVSTAATSVAPTTKAPATSAPVPADVAIPALKGLSSQQARQALDRVGLTYRLKFLPSDAPPGTVLDSDPAEGREVPADTEVTLFLAMPRSSPSTTGTPATPLGADEPDE